MAGGGGALGRPQGAKRGKHSKRKKKKRIGFHLDMTPLVDITFLLLTFFMFTTTMLKPQVMEMKIPPERFDKVEVPASKLLTIILNNEGKAYWYSGIASLENPPQSIVIDSLKRLAFEQNLKPNIKNELITVLKIDEEAKYEFLIKILDQLNQAEIGITQEISKETEPDAKTGQLVPKERKRRFTLVPYAQADKDEIDKIGGLK